jgi:hypothetical protein
MRKKINQEETQPQSHQVSEPSVAYGMEANANAVVLPIKHSTEPFKTDEYGRIILSDEMRDAVSKAEQSLAEGTCLTEEMFLKRFAKWL